MGRLKYLRRYAKLRNLRVVAKYPKTVYYPVREVNGFSNSLIYKTIASKVIKQEDLEIVEKEWSNLIILDAARYDFFKKVNDISGDLTKRLSGRSSTKFVKTELQNKQLKDVVCVTQDDKYDRYLNQSQFHHYEYINQGRRSYQERRNLEKEMIEKIQNLRRTYPEKRLLTHFMRPHIPWISEYAEDLRSQITDRYDVTFKFESADSKSDHLHEPLYSLYHARQFGLINDAELRKAYEKEMQDIIQSLARLIKNLNGKTIITADHGEMLGERMPPLFVRHWGHHGFNKEKRTVPWLEVD